LKLKRYFKALKEYQGARSDLRRTGERPEREWLKEAD